MNELIARHSRRPAGAFVSGAVLTALALGAVPVPVLAAVPTIPIAQYPLTVAVPAHPQVLLAVGNSQSMDGDLSGAIWTGSGGLGAGFTGLNASGSPVNYVVPAGFTAPLTNTAAGGSTAYTVTTGGTQYDNSASRLNVAKAGITSILNGFLPAADFGLIDYQTSGNNALSTWVYYMSQPGGFTFTNVRLAGTTYVANPCYQIPLDNVNSVDSSCKSLATRYANINTFQWMAIQDSSDEPSISDVLYAGGLSPVFVQFNGPFPANPFTNFTLGQYNNGGVGECYNATLPSQGFTFCETPTNAGFVPYSAEVMNIQRGFGFYTFGESAKPGNATSWPPLIPMTTAGQSPTQASINNVVASFAPYLAPETNRVNTPEIKAQATQSAIAGLLVAAQDYYAAVNPASSNGCPPNRYVVLVTDGLPTMDLNGLAWPPLGSAAATGWNVTASFNADGSFASTNSQALTDTINTLTTLNNTNKIKTYIIALGAGVADSTGIVGKTLTSMAIAGGSNTYYSAQSAAQLNSAMSQILAKILAETAATSAASVNSTGINTKSVAFQGKFTTADTQQDWTGNLLAFRINSTTGQINTSNAAALWSAQTQLDAQYWDTGRLIATWDPVARAGIPFRWNPSATATSGIAPSTALGTALQNFPADTNGQDVLNFLRGSNAQERLSGGQFRDRTHKLGDIVDSAPLYIAGPSGPWQQASYFAFEKKWANRPPLVYVGANDGMLHAFDATTGNATSGNEIFAFIPNGVWNNLTKLANPYYNGQHWFYVDGSPNAADVQFSSDQSWHTLLLGSESGGGSSIFALDVTNPAAFVSEAAVASAALWEFTDGNMGLSYSSPIAVSTAAGFAIMFGNGYDSPTGQPYLYALNPQTGAVMAKMNLCTSAPSACNGGLPNGLSSITSVNTSGLLSTASNIIYAGDLQGNLWRVDISSANPSSWTAAVLFQARDPSGNAQPITVAPAVSLNPLAPTLTGTMVYFGTGQFLSVADLGNSQVQTIYGVFDSGTAPASPLLRASLQQQTMSNTSGVNSGGVTVALRQLSNNSVLLPSKKGWYVDLTLLSGERDITDPTIFNGTVQLTTYQPNPSPCTSGGNSYLMVFNYATGGATTMPQFDWAGNNNVGSADVLPNGTVAGVSLGTSYASAPKMVTGLGGARAYTTSGAGETNTGNCNLIAGTTSCIPAWANADNNARGAWQEIR
jgi:type IV pilus assembly protein PilY1